MSPPRPTVAPQLVAALIEATPDRVRRRLDRDPNAAAAWQWQANEQAWSIDAGGETVTLPLTHIDSLQQLRCTCLLSPKCFHVLASVTTLSVGGDQETLAKDPETADDSETMLPSDGQQRAATELLNALARLLRVGVASAGVVVQSGLLRAVHQCRAEGLHRLASLGLRVNAGANDVRSRSKAADPAQLAVDVADALETARHLLSATPVAAFWIGTARRRQKPVRPRKLHGLFAEPIITRSGFTGAAVYFLGEDDRIYSASDVRPGDAQHARDAYLGGIEIGPLIQPAKQLARGLYLGTDLTASDDGRLGRGKSVRIVEQGASTWVAEAIQNRFQQTLLDQWNAVYAQTNIPADLLPAGWDFVFVQGRVLGAVGPELLLQPKTHPQPIRLAIANESESLFFRENLRMLSYASGLPVQLIGRMNVQDPRMVYALALGSSEAASTDEPRLEIPPPFAGRLCLGFDEIARPFLVNARPAPVVLAANLPVQDDDPLDALRRRWIATMLAGLASQRPTNTNLLRAEANALQRQGFGTAAGLLDSLTRSDAQAVDTFLATAIYLRTCSGEWARARATIAL